WGFELCCGSRARMSRGRGYSSRTMRLTEGSLAKMSTCAATLLVMCACGAAWGQQAAASTKPADAEPTSALEAAQVYGGMFQSGKASEAVKRFWDLDSMIDGMFVQDKDKITAAQRQDIKETFKKFVDALYTDPRLTAAMAQSTFGDFATSQPVNGVTEVTFNLSMATGQKLPNKLFLKQVDGKWRVIDAQAGAAALGASLN